LTFGYPKGFDCMLIPATETINIQTIRLNKYTTYSTETQSQALESFFLTFWYRIDPSGRGSGVQSFLSVQTKEMFVNARLGNWDLGTLEPAALLGFKRRASDG